MSVESAHPEQAGGYLSAESKQKFTLVAGILGAVFFLAQFLLPMLLMFPLMIGTSFPGEFKTPELEQAAIFGGELWFVERTIHPNWRDVEKTAGSLALAHLRLRDLSAAGPTIPLEAAPSDGNLEMLVIGDRLWLLGNDAVGYYERGSLARLVGDGRPGRASQPFAFAGSPAVVTLGTESTLATLKVEGRRAEWASRAITLGLPAQAGTLRTLQAVEEAGSVYLFAQLCTEDPARCSLSYRELAGEKWRSLLDDVCSCATWKAIGVAGRPGVVLWDQERGQASRIRVATVGVAGPEVQPIDLAGDSGKSWVRWRPFAVEGGLVLVAEGMPGSLRLAEVAGGRVVRTVRKRGSAFPFFGPQVMLLMLVPQLLPIVLSLILAFVLTVQMRRHRVPEYVFGTARRKFASLWQRAIAQLVDLVPFLIGFALPMLGFWRVFSDPEVFLENPMMGIWSFGLFAASFLWALIVLVLLSYCEGRSGKTPGKWLMGIRVLGTDLRPCGFGRAFLRNLLTFADGFFSFMVGALLVALTENWQRLGDMAARTIVVVDEKPA